MVGLLTLSACSGSADQEGPRELHLLSELAAAHAVCRPDSVRPATGAPAEGLWVYEDGATLHRVAAMVGPPHSPPGSVHLIRRVETLETRPGVDPIRYASDTASVRLELVPPFARPAAVYPVSALVRLSAYEPCVPGIQEPLIRYLRRDGDGGVATDVMLQRTSPTP